MLGYLARYHTCMLAHQKNTFLLASYTKSITELKLPCLALPKRNKRHSPSDRFPARRHAEAADGVADRHLSQREEGGDEHQAGHRQHGRGVLHAAGGHGAQPVGLLLGAPALLEAAALGARLGPPRLPSGHQ